MPMPFFSIVLPTKNRPRFLRDTISSVLLQNFDDYELIVSDNFNDEKTKEVVDEFRDNTHIRYFRTESALNIPDHWEYATTKGNGLYTLILTDRSFLKQGALRDIYDTIRYAGNPPVVFWKYGYFEEEKKILRDEKEEPGMKMVPSADLLKKFSRTFDAHFLPRPHVGCYRQDLAERIRRSIGRLYLPFGPDFTSSLLLLAYSDTVMYIPRPLVFFQGAAVSSGTKAQLSIAEYLHSLNVENPHEYVPIKASFNGNLIMNDFLKIKTITGEHFKDATIDWIFYFGKCYQELIEKNMLWGVEKKDLANYWKEWKRALLSFDEKIQKEVRNEVRIRWVNIVKSYLRKTSIGNFLMAIKRMAQRKQTHFYENALAAGGFHTSASLNRRNP